jgi:hypothetical protein
MQLQSACHYCVNSGNWRAAKIFLRDANSSSLYVTARQIKHAIYVYIRYSDYSLFNDGYSLRGVNLEYTLPLISG